MMMKGGKYQSRSHALMNNPIIRNYLKGNIITSNAFPSTSSTTTTKTITTIPTIPNEEERITTQPSVVIGKRKREDDDDQTKKVDRKGKGKESIEVSYTSDNLPPVLTKCKPFFHSIPFRLKF
jgi:hypothetical protein